MVGPSCQMQVANRRAQRVTRIQAFKTPQAALFGTPVVLRRALERERERERGRDRKKERQREQSLGSHAHMPASQDAAESTFLAACPLYTGLQGHHTATTVFSERVRVSEQCMSRV